MQARPQRVFRKDSATIVKLGDEASGYKYELQSAPKKGLVLSGGGVKGLAYCGMIQEMHNQGFLQNLTHVSGASAGAMTASLIAIGMSPEDITKLATGLEINKLLDRDGFCRVRARGDRFENVLEIIYMLQIKKHLDGMGPLSEEQRQRAWPLLCKIGNYKQALSAEPIPGIKIDSVDDIITLAKDSSMLTNLDKRFEGLVKEIKGQQDNLPLKARITFSDLNVLKAILPGDKKHLIKHLSVVTTNQNKKQPETYNQDNQEENSIAEIVQFSGAHPVLFSPRKNAQGHMIADGGISDNMPVQPLLMAGLDLGEILCVKAETNASFQARVNAAQNPQRVSFSILDEVFNNVSFSVFGGAVASNRIAAAHREKIFYNLDQMLYLNTGSITTTTVSPTQQEIEVAIDGAKRQTIELLARANIEFSHPLLAMMYLGKQYLDKTLKEEAGDMFWASAQAGSIFAIQEALANKLRNNESASDTLDPLDSLKRFIFENDDINLEEEDKNILFELCIKQVDFLTEGKLTKCIEEKKANPANSGQVAWYTWLLNLLWTPIAWIIRKFSTKERELEAMEVEAIKRVMASEEMEQVNPSSVLLGSQTSMDDETTECKSLDLLRTGGVSVKMGLEALKLNKGEQNDDSAYATRENSAFASR